MMRKGDWMITFSGVQFWPLDPRPEDVFLVDIATGLANECRYGGQIWPAFVVGQHSVLVALSLPKHLRKQGLFHDATEAYIKDIPRPIKRHLRDYRPIETTLAGCIGRRFGIELVHLDPLVHEADVRCLATERRDLLPPQPVKWGEAQGGNPTPWLSRISPWTHEEAKKAFLGLAWELGIKELEAA